MDESEAVCVGSYEPVGYMARNRLTKWGRKNSGVESLYPTTLYLRSIAKSVNGVFSKKCVKNLHCGVDFLHTQPTSHRKFALDRIKWAVSNSLHIHRHCS